jgi:hypothetical protein
MYPKSVQVWCERFFRTSGPKRLPVAPWMKPRLPTRSAVWQRTRLRPVPPPEESAAQAVPVAKSAATLTPLKKLARTALHCRKRTHAGTRLPERLLTLSCRKRRMTADRHIDGVRKAL